MYISLTIKYGFTIPNWITRVGTSRWNSSLAFAFCRQLASSESMPPFLQLHKKPMEGVEGKRQLRQIYMTHIFFQNPLLWALESLMKLLKGIGRNIWKKQTSWCRKNPNKINPTSKGKWLSDSKWAQKGNDKGARGRRK